MIPCCVTLCRIPLLLQWNEEEVYRFLMKWYGGEPGSGNPHDAIAAAGGPAAAAAAAALTAADEETSSADGDASSGFGSGFMLGDVINMLGVVAALGVCYWLFRRSQRQRRGLGAAGAKGFHKGHHHVHHHVGVHGQHVSNGDSWAGRDYAQKRDMN
jgi:hypothetical protein